MTRPSKLHANLLANPAQVIGFRDFERLLAAAGFVCKRERGSHKSWRHPAMPEVLTVQAPFERGAARTRSPTKCASFSI